MATGYQYKITCFPSLSEAKDAYYFDIPTTFSFSTSDNSLKQFQYKKVASIWVGQHTTFNNSGVATLNWSNSSFTAPSFPSCSLPNTNSENFSDGMTIGWGVAGAMIITFLIRRVFR